ncbi:hypothetical protein P6B95_07170 [Streptomyces atratus]|nr:hypothetical protein [Streptomyces atratus]WPW33772.1 hypothetical protein P6B95_07170 [Streptomyces atratus]
MGGPRRDPPCAFLKVRGRHDYPTATCLLINADAGGSNGYRTRA